MKFSWPEITRFSNIIPFFIILFQVLPRGMQAGKPVLMTSQSLMMVTKQKGASSKRQLPTKN
jgi:hypothetical protein